CSSDLSEERKTLVMIPMKVSERDDEQVLAVSNLGRDMRAIGHRQDLLVIAFTHFHWDHLQGFPFFAPAYNPKQKITILTLGQNQTIGNLREIFEVPLQSQYFPVQLNQMGAQFEFLKVDDASKQFPVGVDDVETNVTGQRHNH